MDGQSCKGQETIDSIYGLEAVGQEAAETNLCSTGLGTRAGDRDHKTVIACKEEEVTEAGMRQIVVKALQGLDAMSVENPVRPGTPDINYIEGWVELKVLDKWPARPNTKIKVQCFTPQQRVWLRRRNKRGGAAFFLILIDKDWLLFDGETAGLKVGHMDKNEMIESSLMYSEGKLDDRMLYRILQHGKH